MKTQKVQTRKVKRGRAKDYQRGAKYYDHFYIRVNNKDHGLRMNGWDGVAVDARGEYAVIDGVKYKLDYSNVD